MKTNMKKLFLLSLIVLVIVTFWLSPAMADPVTSQLLKQPYAVTLAGETYQMSFRQGPFGPGYNGVAVLSGRGTSYSYQFRGFDSGLIQVEGLCDFYFAGDELVWIESTFFKLRAQTEPETINIE